MCVLQTTQAAFTPTSNQIGFLSTVSQTVALTIDANSTKIFLQNAGQTFPIWVALGDSTVTANTATSFAIPPNTSIYLALNSAAYLAFVSNFTETINALFVSVGY